VDVARRREEMFLRKFARIASRLAPKQAFPFAAHFVLPDERNWWISELRLAMGPPAPAVAKLLRGAPIEVHDLQPGDFVDHGRVHATPAAPVEPAEVRRAVLARHPQPRRPSVDAQRFARLVEKLEAVALRNLTRVRSARPMNAVIRLWDHAPEAVMVRLREDGAEVVRVPADDVERHAPALVLETRADLLETAAEEEYGRDLLCIGYGALIHVRSEEAARANLHERLLSLITPFPTWTDRLRHHPVRCLQYLWRDPGARLAAVRSVTRFAQRQSPLYTADDWI